ncbi:TIGR04255 family protein [Streptomyces phaeochromogenes]|uniref:TIGR04255 family protein n=1 Tax=Streptomyces phaeochromogenes TaxID=1923 RepID=UPI00224CB790|nr:TIGR04255 family protein [Streptomyces phaeochromogenes]MCX5601602.1 TIGR04255 family protein [Streptomyces phaeochromogenes]
MGHREIYPNPPLALSVVELRHTETTALTDADQASLKAFLSDTFPLARPARRINVTMSAAGVNQEQLVDPRYMTRDNSASITYRKGSIVVETTRYERRSTLRELLHQAVEARQKVAPADGIERIGIRYINEVRAPEIEGPADWKKWITPALTSIGDLKPETGPGAQSWQGMAVFGGTHSGTLLRHGIFEGYAVDPGGDLRRVTPPPGPFFLVDLDSFWVPEGETPTLDWDNIESHFDGTALRAYSLFEQLITDQYRQEVLRRDR